MQIIVGHTNSDLDCFGSMTLAKYLYPQAVLIRSNLIHPVAKNLAGLYSDYLDMKSWKDVKVGDVDKLVIVDTRTLSRVKEVFAHLGEFKGEIEIWDHHPADSNDIPGAVIHEAQLGANTTLLGLEAIRRGIVVGAEDATIALTGIYADTGNFTHENVTESDFEVARYLKSCGASLDMVQKFLKRLSGKTQVTLFHEILNRIVYYDMNGHFVGVSFFEMDEQEGGLAAVVEEVHEVENTDATFCVFGFRKDKSCAIIARSQMESIPVNKLLKEYDGGGHILAASAYIKNVSAADIHKQLIVRLQREIIPACVAADLMTRDVKCIREDWTLKDASIFLEETDHTGAPVVNDAGELAGIISLRDIMKGRRAEQMNAPVTAYMTRKVVTIPQDTAVRVIEHIIYNRNIGHLPVTENGKILGIITRTDLLDYMTHRKKRDEIIMANFCSVDPESPSCK